MKLISNKKGFFVIETIVVIAIVAIVVTYVFSNFSNSYSRFIASESYDNINTTNVTLYIKEYLENLEIDYSLALGTNSYLEISSITKVPTEYYIKLKEHLNIKRAYLFDLELFFSDPYNLSYFDTKFQNYLKTLAKVESKYVFVVELDNSNYAYISIYNYSLELVGDEEREYVTYIKINEEYVEPGYDASDKEGNRLDVLISGTVDTSTSGVYYLTYTLQDLIIKRKVVVYDSVFDYDYTGDYQVFRAPLSGKYLFELWGASGAGADSGRGGYTSGEVYLLEGQTFYIYVGGNGGTANGYNGGGAGYSANSFGGGATDIRLMSGLYNNALGLKNRIMVAGAGGGNQTAAVTEGDAGGTVGFTGVDPNYPAYTSTGGTQTGGGIVTNFSSAFPEGTNGGFGFGGIGGGASNGGSFGGGSGYYGGAGGSRLSNGRWAGGGGSSFVSGSSGVNAIWIDGTHSGEVYHFSGFVFDNAVIVSGQDTFLSPAGANETGHSGNGYARISLLKPNENNTLSKVRYIYNEVRGNSDDNSAHWVELQAYDSNGNNVSFGRTTISKSYELAPVNLSLLTNGNTNTSEYIEGGEGVSFIMLDLGQEYDLTMIKLWHKYENNRTYIDNVIRVAGNDENYRTILDYDYKESSYGKIIRPKSID